MSSRLLPSRSRLPFRAGFAAATLVGASGVLAQAPMHPTPTAPASAAASAAKSGTDQLLPLEVTVNGSKQGNWVLLERAGTLYAPVEALGEWRVQTQSAADPVTNRGTTYLPLSSIPGFKARINLANQSLDLEFSAQAFAATRLTTELSKRPVVSPVLPSVILNYDLSYTTTRTRGSPNIADLGAVIELGGSGPWGVLTSSHAGRNLLADPSLGQGRQQFTRLETTFTRDLPAANLTLRAGDTSTRAGMWGRTVYFGGVQVGTNYGLTPGFLTQPSPLLSGTSTAPSTVELYVNDVLRQVSNVPSGPFVIDNYGALTGSGEARLVVRDVLGREAVITQPFFTSSQLLAAGLTDWSFEAGRLRFNIGQTSNDYGEGFASGILRQGWSNDLTLESRVEATRITRSLGFGAVAGLPWQMIVRGAVAGSQTEVLGAGHLWLLGLERQTLRTGAFLQVQGASIGFRQLGQEINSVPTRVQVAGNFSFSPSPELGSLGVGFAAVSRFNAARVFTVSANYSRRIGESSTINVTATRAVAGQEGSSVSMHLVVPLESNQIVSTSATLRNGEIDAYTSTGRSPSYEGGFGWRLLAGRRRDEQRAEANSYYFGRYGQASADVSVASQTSALRVGASGGLVAADGHLFATRRVDDGFAIVEVPGYADVGVGLGSNYLTRTDSSGTALVPRLMAYQNNSVRVNPSDLPISAELDSIEQIAVPAWRSGVKVRYPVREGRGALVRLLLEDGEPAPAGAVVSIEGEKEEFYVARRGESFVTGLKPANRLSLRWKGRFCAIDVALPPDAADEIPRIGPFVCKGVLR